MTTCNLQGGRTPENPRCAVLQDEAQNSQKQLLTQPPTTRAGPVLSVSDARSSMLLLTLDTRVLTKEETDSERVSPLTKVSNLCEFEPCQV